MRTRAFLNVTLGDEENTSREPAGSRWTVPGLIGILAIGLACWATYSHQAFTNIDQSDYAARTEQILRTTPLIDGHNDLPFLLRLELHNQIYDNKTFPFRDSLASHTDLARMKEGQVGGQFWSVFVECDDLADLNDPTHAVRDTLEQIDVARRFIAETHELQFCGTASCARKAFKRGKIPSMLGAEGLHQTGSSIAVIRQLYDLGVRYITVTHNCDNPYATAASTVTETGEDGGLTAFGAAAIKEMNRLGMMVDLAHVSHQTMRDVLEVTQAPVIFSHTTCYELAKTYRNAPDDVIARLKLNGGLLMVMFVRTFLNVEEPDAANIETVVDHIMHVVKVAGWDHVGIGGDFDGTTAIADGINSVADYPKLIQAVMRRGATDQQVKQLVGENILRVWRKNEEISVKLSAETRPVEDVWQGRTWFSKWNDLVPRMIPENSNREY
ncbi:hypothetical protein VPNG_05166 [Cytospora leucostoma]|uniref:Dipeptidase n=1 Tax=Cytospora leucostoma TaxID=1230097 RepID=A0A423X7M0_9PEZI|nr:hypothetical protein VPNG_05166 [Cytospora leucostoma]